MPLGGPTRISSGPRVRERGLVKLRLHIGALRSRAPASVTAQMPTPTA